MASVVVVCAGSSVDTPATSELVVNVDASSVVDVVLSVVAVGSVVTVADVVACAVVACVDRAGVTVRGLVSLIQYSDNVFTIVALKNSLSVSN